MHMRERLDRVAEYTGGERARFEGASLVQDAVIRNLQTLTESSQRLSDEIKPPSLKCRGVIWRAFAT